MPFNRLLTPIYELIIKGLGCSTMVDVSSRAFWSQQNLPAQISLLWLPLQILCAAMETNKILLNIDNNRMTADDFRVK